MRELFPWYVVQSTRGKLVGAQPFLDVDVADDVLVVDVLEDVVDELLLLLLLLVETFPGVGASIAKAATATTTRTATATTAPRFTIRGIFASSLKGSQFP